MQLDDSQLATRAGTDIATVVRLRSLGILPAEGELDAALIPRVQLAIRLERSGVSLEVVSKAMADGDLSIEMVDRVFFRPVGMLESTYHDLASDLGVTMEFAEAVQIALGVPAGAQDAWVREDDAATMKSLAELVKLGVEESVIVRLFQVMADNMRRMANAATEMWEDGVSQPLLDSGFSRGQLLGARSADAAQFQLLAENIVGLLWNRFLEEEIFRGTIDMLEATLEETGARARKAAALPAIAFLDLTAFTLRTEQHGDEVAAAGARTLVDVVRRELVSSEGTLVKMLGDGAMLHFTDAAAAVRCALTLVDAIAVAGLPPGRCGISAGPLIVRDVDYFGHTVNVAARLVDYARPGEVLVSSAAVAAVEDAGLEFAEIGPVSLKGVAELVTVFSARRSG